MAGAKIAWHHRPSLCCCTGRVLSCPCRGAVAHLAAVEQCWLSPVEPSTPAQTGLIAAPLWQPTAKQECKARPVSAQLHTARMGTASCLPLRAAMLCCDVLHCGALCCGAATTTLTALAEADGSLRVALSVLAACSGRGQQGAQSPGRHHRSASCSVGLA